MFHFFCLMVVIRFQEEKKNKNYEILCFEELAVLF
jgi:hypothetical protein